MHKLELNSLLIGKQCSKLINDFKLDETYLISEIALLANGKKSIIEQIVKKRMCLDDGFLSTTFWENGRQSFFLSRIYQRRKKSQPYVKN